MSDLIKKRGEFYSKRIELAERICSKISEEIKDEKWFSGVGWRYKDSEIKIEVAVRDTKYEEEAHKIIKEMDLEGFQFVIKTKSIRACGQGKY